jgi:hypothetical protein
MKIKESIEIDYNISDEVIFEYVGEIRPLTESEKSKIEQQPF